MTDKELKCCKDSRDLNKVTQRHPARHVLFILSVLACSMLVSIAFKSLVIGMMAIAPLVLFLIWLDNKIDDRHDHLVAHLHRTIKERDELRRVLEDSPYRPRWSDDEDDSDQHQAQAPEGRDHRVSKDALIMEFRTTAAHIAAATMFGEK